MGPNGREAVPRAVSTTSLGSWYHSRRHAVLFYTLLFTLVASPVIAAIGRGQALIEVLLAGNLLAAVTPLQAGRGRRVLLAAIVLVCVARPVTAWIDPPALSVVTLEVWILAGLMAAAAALRFALGATSVTSEHVYAALSAYLLAGLYFGLAYWVVEQVAPGTFAGGLTLSTATYFSFVTLATLGYGDIVPVGEIGRGLAIVEGIGGQLFLAVMVARLVSLYASRR